MKRRFLPKILLAAAMVFASAGLMYDSHANSADAAGIDYSRDCDKYAVMYCGSMTKSEMLKKLNNGDGVNSAENIKNIFSQFNLNTTKIKNANFKDGVVYKNGEVKVEGKVVATNAQTYIRHLGGKGSTSRMGSAQAAKVAMNSEGKFLFAVMTPCGNPVTAKPVEPPKPQSISCDALQVTITNKKNRTVEAKVSGSAKNTTISGYKIDFGDGTKVNQKTATHSYSSYGKYTVTGYVKGKVDGTNKTVTSKACVKHVEFEKPPKPQESLTCDMLGVKIINNKDREVEAKVSGSAKNTTISGYKIDFGDGNVVEQQEATNTYVDYGKYTVKGYVTGTVDGKQVTVGGDGNCVKHVEFEKPPEPEVQSIVCDALTIDLFNEDKRYVKVSLTGTAQNTTITGYKIEFGTEETVNESSAEHIFSDWGTYTIKGYVTGTVDGEEVTVGGTGNCEQSVEFKEDIKPCPTNPSLPIDDPKCKPCEYNSELNYDDPNCKPAEVPELPDTGAGALVGLFSGVSILGAVGHRLWLGRKLS